MITQRVKLDVNNQQGPTIYARTGEKNLRQIVFIITSKDEESGEDVAVDIPAGAVGQLRILKPSNNFVIVDLVKTTLESGSVIFTATLPEQAVTVGGLSYYDVRIEETTSKFVFSATGHMIVDDAVISSGVLEDVSEVNGLVFPDDFLTTEDHFATIDDTTTSTESTWSSAKISDAIASIDLPPAREYSAVEKIVGKWFNQDLYAITYHDSYTSPGSGAHTTQHSLPGDVKLVEPHYIRYTYSGGVYMLIGNQMQQYLNINIPDTASPTYFNATQTVGNVDQTDIYYTVYYTKEVSE